MLSIRPKTLAVLQYLIDHAGRLVTKTEILDAVWTDTAVGEWVLTGCVQELRRLVADDARQPRIIQTVHGRGYRFIAPIERPTSANDAAPPRVAPMREAHQGHPGLVGRETELQQLAEWLQRACTGERQLVFVAGEAGIGKTTLADEFLGGLGVKGLGGTGGHNPITPNPLTPSLLIARGQCVEQHGEGEPYLPVLEALGRLSAGPDGERLVALLRRHAPAWLVQLPGLLDSAEAEALERRLGATTRERMLREMASFVAALPEPLVLLLEDLHWSDHATVDLLAMLAQRRDAARLLIIATYRPVDVTVREHPFKGVHQELRARGCCRDIWLQPLTVENVAEYLRTRWPGLDVRDALANAVFERTDGNPLFLVNIADYLVAEGLVAEADGRWTFRSEVVALGDGAPLGLRQMITMHIDRLRDSDRVVLEAASVIGRGFSAALVAAAVDGEIVAVEQQIARLAHAGQFVRSAGEQAWPDGTVAGAYELTHFLYQSVLRHRVSPARRRQLHARVAARLEQAYGMRTVEVGVELAHHFEMSGDLDRAIPHLEEAAARAVGRGAGHEAVAALERGLALLEAQPVTAERTLQRIRLSIALGAALPTLHGFGHPTSEAAFSCARALSEETNDSVQLFRALASLAGIYVAQGRLVAAAEAASGIGSLMTAMPLPPFLLAGNLVLGIVQFHSGNLATAQAHFEQALAVGEVPVPAMSADMHVYAANYLSLALAHRGFPDQARARHREAGERAAETERPFDRLMTLQFHCFLYALLRDVTALGRAAQEGLSLATELDLVGVRAVMTVARGRARAADGEYAEGAAAIAEGIAGYRTNGQRIALPTLLAWHVETHVHGGDLAAAQTLLDEAFALVRATGDLRYLAELHRLQGRVLQQVGDVAGAEQGLRQAMAVARDQGARWWELRAATALAQLTPPGSDSAARSALSALVATFHEGADTVDMRAAQALLRQ